VRIQASCVRVRGLPKPEDPSGQAGIFEGRYLGGSSLQPTCGRYIKVANPWSASSAATVKVNTTGGPLGFLFDCSPPEGASTIVEISFSATISMLRPHLGVIRLETPVATFVGHFSADANGRLEDEISWAADGATGSLMELVGDVKWTKLPGAAYDKDSKIGPKDNGAGWRVRNPEALVRWNWGLDRIDQPSAALDDVYHYGAATGNGTTLYSLDTGILIDHDDFGGRAVPGFSAGCPTGMELGCLDQWVYKGVIDGSRTCHEHGTHVASTAAGTLYGVASAAEIVAVQVLNCADGSGSDEGIVQGIDWVIHDAKTRPEPRPSVISMSLGGDERDDTLDHALKEAADWGILVVVAAGNDGIDADACVGSPSASAYVLTVGASGLAEQTVAEGNLLDTPRLYDVVADFSDTGKCVDLFAPGVEVLAAIPTPGSTHYTSIMSGTSMATPLVAGVALQLWGLHPTLSPDQIKHALLCASAEGLVRGLPAHEETPNRLLQGGAQLVSGRVARLIAQQQQQEAESASTAAGLPPIFDFAQCDRGMSTRSQSQAQAHLSRRGERSVRTQAEHERALLPDADPAARAA